MQNLVPYVTRSGDKYNIPPDQEEAFRADFGEDAQPAASFRTKDGEHYQVPQSMAEDFRKDFPDAQPVRRLSFANGTTRDFTSDELRKFFQDEYVTSPDYKQDRDEDDVRQKRQMEALRLAQSEEEGKAESERRLAEAKKQGEERYDMEQRAKSESRGTFWQELGRRMFTAEGIRENAQGSVFARPYAYLNDLANSLVGGLLKGSAKIEEGFGRIWGETGDALGNKGIKDAARAMVADAQAGQAAVDRNLPTDMLDTQGKGAVNKVLQVGKNVAGMTGEFAPVAVPGVGQAYAASLVSAGTVNRYAQVYDEATRNGIDPRKADGLAFGAATVDALTNMLLMGKFRGIWSGEKKAMADMAKKRFVQRALGVGMETAKVGGTMAANGAWQEIVDEGAKGAANPDWAKVGEVAFDQFIEGGLFHLVNSGAHHATRIDWSKEPDGIPAGAARDMMESPEGRALIFCNSPQAAAQIFRARKNGEDVSRKMIRDLGLSGNTGLTVADRNAIGDRLLADYQAFKERVRTKMDDVQASALADEIASRSDEGYDNPAFEKVWTKAVAQIKDAREIDDPERRREIVDEALKTTETKGERLQRAKAVKAYNEKLAAEHEAAVSQSRDSSPKAGEETPTQAAPTEKTAQKPPESTKSDEIRPMEPSAGVGTGNDTPKAAKPVEGEKSGSVTAVYVADIKPGEHFTYNGKELYKNKDGEIVEVDVDKDGKRIERPTRRHFTGEELVDLPDQVESADVKPADGVPRAEEKPAEDTTGSEPARKQVNKGKGPVPAAASEPPPKPKAKNKGKKPPVEKSAAEQQGDADQEAQQPASATPAPAVNKGKGKKPVAPAKPPPEPKRTFVDDAGRTHEVNEDISRQLRQNARGEVNRIVNVKSKGVIEEARKQVKRVAASMTNDDLSASLAETVREERRNTTGGKASDILLEEAKSRGLEVAEKPKEMPQPGEWIVGRVDGDSAYAVAGRVLSADARGIVVQYYGGHNKVRAGKTVGEETFKAVVPTDAVDLSIRDPLRPAKASAKSPAVAAADDFVVRNTTLSRDGASVANGDINHQGEVKPPPRAEGEPRKPFAKPLKAVDAPAAAKEMAGHASQDVTRKALTGVHVEKGLMVATDGRHMVIAPAPKGWTDGEYGADGKPVGDDRVYPNWRQVVLDVKKVGYSKIGTVANGDAATDAVDFASALRKKVVAVTKYDNDAPTVAIGDAACNPSYVSDILGTMFRLGAKSVDVWHRDGKGPVVFKGRNADGEITAVLMPLRYDGESAAERGFTHVRMPLEAPKPKNKGKGVKAVQAAKALGSPDAASPLRPAPKGAELVQGEFDGMGGETAARPEATALKGKSDLSKPDNVKALREYMKAVSPAPIPQRLSDGSPKAALEWFEANMVGKTFSFDIPGYGHREFTVKPGHIGTLVCKGGRNADGTKIVKGRIAKAGGDARLGFEMVRNGEVSASDVEGWDVLRAKSLPLLPEVFNSFDVAFHEKDARGNDIIILAKKFVNKKGRPNVVVMKLIDDGKTIGPVSAHVKDMTDSWLKNKDLLLTDEGKVYDRSADNSASRRPTSGDNAERNSPETASILPRPAVAVKGGEAENRTTLDGQAIRPADLAGGDAAERPQHEEAKKPSSDPQNAARNPAALRDPAFVKWAKSKGRAPTPFARRAYDAAQLRAAVPLYRNVFPDMNIVIHDKVEDPAKWTANHPDGTQKMIGGVGGASNMGIKGAADAEALEKAGKDREEIWRKTGWWRAKDGQWRFEMPSTKMKDARELYSALIEGNNETKLEKILNAPELFKAYPQLRDTKIILSPDRVNPGEAAGWYDRIKNEIVLLDAGLVSLKDMPARERDLRDTYQKVLDSDEFVRRRLADMDAFGIEHGTVEEEREYARWWINRQDKGIDRTNETRVRDLANDRRVWSAFGKIIHEVQHAVQRIEGFASGASGEEDGYSRFAGEVEARNAARREAMSPEERAATPPWASEDVAEGTQIIRRMIVDPKSGEVLGWYTPQFKEVHLNPGATVETLAHEMLHAVQDWAKMNSPKLAKALDDIARDCPERLRKRIMRAYGVVSPETIMKEWGAFNFMGGPEGGKGKGGAALRDELANRENAAWLGRFWSAAKDAWKDMAAKMGGNRIDLDAIDSKTPQEAMDFLARAFAEGGTVGKANPPGKSVRPAIDMTKPLSVAEKWEVNLHDHRNPLKWLRDEMAKRGSSFADDTDFYEAARLQKGRDQAAVNDANRRLKEYTGKLKKLGVKHEEVVEFMQAQAAKDRNAMILEKFGRENGSGMTDAEAARTIKAFEDAGKGDALREISDFLLDMQREGLQYRVDAGLLSAEDAQRMADREPFHVPFRSAVDPETGDYVQWGSDKALEKAEFREAKGRKTLADDVVGWMFSEFIDAHTRGNENRVRKMIADAMRLNAKSGVGKILKGARKQSAYDFSAGPYKTGANGDGLTGDKAKTAIVDDPRFRESRKNGDGGRKNVLAFKEGGQTHYIEFAEGERGERLQAAVNGRDLRSMGKLWNRGMRFWSSTATEWAPTFALRNFAADNIDVFGNYIGEHGIVKGAASYARHLKNAAALTPAITRYIATGEIPQGAGGEWIRRYEESGGMIAGYASEGYGEITAKIDAEIAKGGRSKGAAIARNVALAVPRAVAAVNRYAELLTRISAFRTQCENGMTDHKAALWSRESTVDFNEKGNFTGITNGLWMFSNSTLGASARQMKSIFKSKYGWQTVAAFVGYGFAEGALEALMNGDDDGREAKGEGAGKDVSEYTRANSLYVRTGGRVYRAPFHAGPFSYIKYAGNCAARIAFGRMKPEDAAKELGVEAVSQLFHYTGVGSVNLQSQSGRFADDAATFAGTAAPSVAQPLVQGAFNIDYAGRSIYNEGFPGDRTPRSAQGRRATPGWAKGAAAWLNEATRSEGHETGYVDLAPEIVKMAGEAVGKNLLRDVMNAGTVCAMAFGDEKYDVRNVPVARDFVREVDGNDRRYNDARKEYEANASYLKRHAAEMSAREREAYVKKFPHARFVAKGKQTLDALETEIRRLRKMEDGYIFKKGKATRYEWPQEKLDEFRAKRRGLQAKFLKAMGM